MTEPGGYGSPPGAALLADPRRAGAARRGGAPGALRVRSILLVVVALAAFAAAGRAAGAGGGAPAAISRGTPLLPVVQVSSSLSQIWECPGPLPVGAGPEHSFVDIVDPGSRSAVVTVALAPAAGSSSAVASSQGAGTSRQVSVPAGTEQSVGLPVAGAAGYAAASVISGGAQVAVSEVVTGGVEPIESPCALGTSVTSYLAPASTADRSDVELAVADPTATPAVVDIRAYVGDQSVSPPPLQGLAVPANGITVLDLGHFVVQQRVVGVAVTATSGRVVTGALEHLFEPHVGAGNALVTGVGSPRSTWVLTPGPAVADTMILVRVLDPGRRPVIVSVSSPFAGQPTSEVTLQVAAGAAAEVPLPVPSAARGSAGGGVGPAPREGAIVVRAGGGEGVVVSAVTSVPVSGQPDVAVVGVPAAEQSMTWLLPGAMSYALANDDVEVANPGSSTAHVVVERFSASGITEVAKADVAAGATTWVKLWETIRNTPVFSLRVTSSASVVVSQAFTATKGRSEAPGIPARP